MLTRLSPENLDCFTGTVKYTWGPFRKFVMTDGVRFVCENHAAWFVDMMASHQSKELDAKADGFQVWKFKLSNTDYNKAVVVCEDGNGKELVRQPIYWTDFPLERFPDGFIVYLEDGYVGSVGHCKVAMLPSEH